MGRDRQRNKSTVEDYVKQLDPEKLDAIWEPPEEWRDLHGDIKSSVRGKFHMECMTGTDGEYKVKLMDGGKKLAHGSWKQTPSHEQIIAYFKAVYEIE